MDRPGAPVDSAASRRAQEPIASERHYRQQIERDPASAPAHDGLGRALNNQGRLEEAAQAFRQSLATDPDFAPAHDHLGHVLRAQGRTAEAFEAFRRAAQIDPDLASAQHNLAISHMQAGDPASAAKHLENRTRLLPGHARAHLDLGICYHTLGRFDAAIEAYQAALLADPDCAEGYLDLGLVYAELRRSEEAEQSFLAALERRADYPDAQAELAALYEETNRLDQARRAVATGLVSAPAHARLNIEAAKCDRRSGDIDAAIARLEEFDLTSLPPRLALLAHFELGNLYDRRGAADTAFEHYTLGNQLSRRSARLVRVDPDRYLGKLDALLRFFAAADPQQWPAAPPPEQTTPYFMVGFPRSGTTLTDLILDAHPRLQTMEESPTVNAVEQKLAGMGRGYPEQLAHLDSATITVLRATYFDAVARSFRRDPQRQLIDKLPIRTVHTGLIWRLFPDTRIIFSARHPCDVVLSGFMQQYAMNDAFANFFTLDSAVRIYDKVMRLWQLYTERLPLCYHVVRYEDLVDDPRTQARRLLDFLEIEWDESVLDYRRSLERGRINTNSYHQVTEPIYHRSRYRWQRYKEYFEPFQDILAPHLARFGYQW